MKEFKIDRTKKGYPSLWESGGGYRNTGYSTIIAGKDGEAKVPVYIKSRGHLANQEHALFIVEVDDHIINADHHREDFEIEVYRIVEIDKENVKCELVHQFSQGEWDTEPQGDLANAVQAAMNKATCYHCREPHYFVIESSKDDI